MSFDFITVATAHSAYTSVDRSTLVEVVTNVAARGVVSEAALRSIPTPAQDHCDSLYDAVLLLAVREDFKQFQVQALFEEINFLATGFTPADLEEMWRTCFES